MKGIIRFSTKNKFAIWLMTIIVTVAGLYSGFTMKQETIPNINVPILMVNTIYPGAAPEEVADQISLPIEQRVKNLNGVSSVSSTSMENASSIVLEYDYSKDMKEAEAELREALSAFTPPKGAQAPKISKLSLNDFPVVSLSVAGKEKSLEDVTKLVEEELKPALEGIDGAGTVAIAGQQIKEVQLKFKKDKMTELGLSEETVKGIVQANALQAPLGLFEFGDTEKTVVVDGNVKTVDQLRNLAIPVIPSGAGAGAGGSAIGAPGAGTGAPGMGAAPGAGVAPGAGAAAAQTQAPAGQAAAFAGLPTVKLSDIADIEVVGKAESISRTNGKESIGINVSKASDANTVDVVNAVKEQADKFSEAYPDLEVVVMLDQGKPIEDSVDTMLEKAVFGAIFAVIVILLFLRNIRTTIISVVSIPLSLVIAILILNQMDITLNIMTLGAMTVAIGRVVDDSIVVIENNYRRMSLSSEKLKGRELIMEATKEMFIPILSSTLVTIAVFLPLGLVSGPIGELFMPFALTMVFSLLASLLVAITVVPMMTHLMFRNGVKGKQHDDKPGALGSAYRRLLGWALNHKIVTFLSAVVLLVASTFLFPLVGVSFIPEEEEKYAMVTYSPGPGTLREDVEKYALEAEKLILARQGVVNLQYSIGGSGNPFGPSSDKSGLFYVQYENDIQNFAEEKEQLVEALKAVDPKGTWAQMDMAGGMGGSQMTIFVYGDTLDEIKPVVENIQKDMREIGSFDKIDSSLSKTYGQYTLVADQEKLARSGLTAGQIAMTLMPSRERPVLTQVTDNGKTYNVYVEADKAEYGSIADIENATLQSPFGPVAVKDVVKVVEGTSSNTVTHKDGKLYVQVTANVTSKDVGKASSDIQAKIDAYDLPPSVKVDFGGVTEQINETFTQLGLAMAAAVAIVYLLLVITFGGGLTPFAILFSLPFTIIGALVGLFLAGETVSAPAMMGMLMLIGIVVTNAIVLIDRVLHKEQEGLSTREALLEAAGTRLRPILMTALATVGALLPLVFGVGGGSGGLISRGLGVTVIGGLISSTLLTLVIVPIVYEFLSRFRRKKTLED
ncbi:efflux RND transporter permease subunit [Paenibacillus thermoaerophilus]|uniref:Efflux RND transporter permease subunit n=1 Tax=Paenibacillus thermoaerophilus TaxID=1215385 RepID=A0ABW2V7J1_9BACL|nr:efflux RND transporter permease subunit [Paenibacillus thermoaerophilus]TMV11070.1 efflux RND transporter permease subunit [Paenibacillus thermoaerophilus]